jgi:TetR/AcrR family transcriptional repressor of nem operon
MTNTATSKDTKTAIMDAAQELIQRRGANAMSYQDISDAVGIRKASIHHHFPAKDDLIQAVIERYADYVLGSMDEIFASTLDPAAKLRKYAALFEATLSQGRRDKACPFAILGGELSSLDAPSTARVRRFYRDSEERLARVVEAGRAEGQFHFKGDPRQVAAMLFALLEGAILIARAEGGPKRLHAVVRQALKLLQE